MERINNEVRCCYCGWKFIPEPVVRKQGKKRRTYVECPRCGNGIEREFRRYDARKVAAAHG